MNARLNTQGHFTGEDKCNQATESRFPPAFDAHTTLMYVVAASVEPLEKPHCAV